MAARYEFDSVNKTNAAASSLLWDDSLALGLARVAANYGARVSDYRVTLRECRGGKWYAAGVIDGADVLAVAERLTGVI